MNVVLGGIITILVAVAIENLRRPRLKIVMAAARDGSYPSHLVAQNVRFLGVEVRNEPLPGLARWMSRATATHCSAEITFHHLDGQNVFGRSMPGRWSGSPEPVPAIIQLGQHTGRLFDFNHLARASHIDIPPGNGERLDVAARLDADSDSYGWNNESYAHSWRNPNWKLPRDRYLVCVRVRSSGEVVEARFRLIADVNRTDFRLDTAMPQDVVRH